MDIKDFPQSSPVTLESRPLFLSAYRHTPPAVSDIAFTSLFGWQELFRYRYSRYRNFLLVFYARENRLFFLSPLMLSGSVADAGWADAFLDLYRFVAAHCRDNNLEFSFCGFPDHYVRHLPKEKFAIIPVRDSDDYIYRKDDLVALAGQKYAGKRNLVRQFSRNYAHHFEPLSKSNIACVYRFIRHWKPGEEAVNHDIATGEYRMVYRLMENFDVLDLCGGILYVDKKEVAATVGAIVRDFVHDGTVQPTAIVHSEHALLEYKGSFQTVNKLFCESLPQEVVYINREEDLGIPGLRKAKLSYYPSTMIQKYNVVLIGEEMAEGKE